MSRTRYGLALVSAATLASLSCGSLVGAAVADPGGVPHQGDHGKHVGQVKQGDDDKQHGSNNSDKGHGQGQSHGQSHGQGHATGQQGEHGNHGGGYGNGGGNGGGNGNGGAHGDPPGNNGTVKIAAPGDAVGHPSNNPHPGCTVVVEWFGYDAGDDVVSTVTFAPQAPTSDITIGGTSPSSVFVGGDAASGGTDLDGRQAYTLTFTGDPHPKQGYHVKLTVATPRSLGNDTKTKVFWVEPCAPTSTGDTPDGDTPNGDTPNGDTSTHSGTPRSGSANSQGTASNTQSAPGSASGTGSTTDGSDSDAAVPTAVDAGEDSSPLPEWARSPLPLVAIAGGLVLVAVALVRRSRHGA